MAELGALTFLCDEFMMDAMEADPPPLLVILDDKKCFEMKIRSL